MATDEDKYKHTLATLTAGGRHAVSVRDAATALDLCVASIWKLVAQEKLRVVRIGRRTLVPAEEIARLLCQGT